jgi:hypothetical protein
MKRFVACLALVWLPAVLPAGPLEFGKAELNAALAARNLNQSIAAEVTAGTPESYRITPSRIQGGDLRGLMYGLLEAAEQIRSTGQITATSGSPATPIRGIRVFGHSADFEKQHTKDYWLAFVQMLARNRFNRLNLVFAHQTDYLAPPYPFWLNVAQFPEIRAADLTPEQQRYNLEMLGFISQTAADHGIDFTLGVWEHNIQNGMKPSVEGITRENIGPYSYAALKAVLHACPAIRSVQMRTNSESGIPSKDQVQFYRDWVFKALHDAGREVALDLRGWVMSPGLLDAAKNAGVPLRLSSKYWAEDLGRPYPPAETWPNYSYINFLEKPRLYRFYWELWGLGSHRLLLWGDPEYVRRAVPTFTMAGTQGFEIDPPLAQKGFGNAPGTWGVFTDAKNDRVFWKYEFERYWMFYTLWGRLSYDPKTPEKVWTQEMDRRFGKAAPDVMEACANASRVLNEIVAVHLADPNMYIWPEINPGGLIDSYRGVRPSDWRYVATIEEAVNNRVTRTPSAKQSPLMTATRLHAWALKTEQALERARKTIDTPNAEWKSTESDLMVLAALARYHGRKQMAADQLTYFYRTGDASGLYAARRELIGALRVWERIVSLTDGVYPPNMSFGPEDKGHWKDKLPYVQHDLKTLQERVNIYERFGNFDYGFDFGGPVKPPADLSYRSDSYVLRNTVEPGFQAVDPKTMYSDALEFGWASDEPRTAIALPLTPYQEVRAVSPDPKHLPENVLFGDSIQGSGPQVFRIKAAAGEYSVQFLKPDGSTIDTRLLARGGRLEITFPAGEWNVSGLVIKNLATKSERGPQHWPMAIDRPVLTHTPPGSASAGKPLKLTLRTGNSPDVVSIRLHYRAMNQLAKFKTLSNERGNTTFTIPAEDVDARWDLMYYFEVLNRQNTGWFQPDPASATPYYIVPTVSVSPAKR